MSLSWLDTQVEPDASRGERQRWHWPVEPARYDQRPELYPDEHAALLALGWQTRQGRSHDPHRPEWVEIERLFRPLNDARLELFIPANRYHERSSRDAVALILHACMSRHSSFWAWSPTTWVDVFGPDHQTIQHRFAGWVDGAVRPYMMAIAYLLGCFSDFHLMGKINDVTLATRVFGPTRVQAAVEPILAVMQDWGYRTARNTSTIPGLVCTLLLLNRSPDLTEMTTAKIEHFRQSEVIPPLLRSKLYGVHRALAALGVVDPPASYAPSQVQPIEGVNPLWLGWVERWTATSTLTPQVRHTYRTILLKVGRWLAEQHPEVREPSQWTRELCAAFVALVAGLQTGDYAQRRAGLDRRLGQSLAACTKASYIGTVRCFFRDCQEWGWMPCRFDPSRALATPASIRTLTGPNPRVIADALWAKLLWAGLNLDTPDLPANSSGQFYPIELVRALALVWLFGGLRSDEIARLRVGCIRWQHEPDGDPELPQKGQDRATICLLDIPAHKTGTAFTKPVDPLIGQAVTAWEAVRPMQPSLVDRRTGEHVHLLFCYRARRVAKEYLNKGVIPSLCRKASIPLADVRGRITSHRARATIASQLYNAKEPMTLFELQAWLGHRSPETTQHYARLTPTTLAKAYTDAGYFARNLRTIEVLIDRDAITSGMAAQGTPWQYFDLGHGYCTYSFFDQCPHRMACARCDFYLPKDSTQSQLLEAQEHLQRMLATIPLTEEEQAAVEEGTEALERLLARLADVPTPTGQTPQQLEQNARNRAED